jgi:hypothetical protein
MFLIDNILLAPVSGVMYIFHEIQAAAEGEAAKSADALRTQLAELCEREGTSGLARWNLSRERRSQR